MIVLLLAAFAQDAPALSAPPAGSAHISLGNRLEADGVGVAVGLREALVIGADGGVSATDAILRYGSKDWIGAVIVPFASFRTANGRTTGLGNLRVEGFRRIETTNVVQLIGLELHIPTGRAYTWANDASTLWPGGGLSAVYQRRQNVGAFDVLVRGSLGLNRTPGIAPFPRTYLHASAAAGVDTSLGFQNLGITGEFGVSVWDPSPIDLAGWMRWEPVDGMRLRGGTLLPIGAWAGLSPGKKPGGVREATLLLDLSLSL